MVDENKVYVLKEIENVWSILANKICVVSIIDMENVSINANLLVEKNFENVEKMAMREIIMEDCRKRKNYFT